MKCEYFTLGKKYITDMQIDKCASAADYTFVLKDTEHAADSTLEERFMVVTDNMTAVLKRKTVTFTVWECIELEGMNDGESV